MEADGVVAFSSTAAFGAIAAPAFSSSARTVEMADSFTELPRPTRPCGMETNSPRPQVIDADIRENQDNDSLKNKRANRACALYPTMPHSRTRLLMAPRRPELQEEKEPMFTVSDEPKAAASWTAG